jgi:hypothetical protein
MMIGHMQRGAQPADGATQSCAHPPKTLRPWASPGSTKISLALCTTALPWDSPRGRPAGRQAAAPAQGARVVHRGHEMPLLVVCQSHMLFAPASSLAPASLAMMRQGHSHVAPRPSHSPHSHHPKAVKHPPHPCGSTHPASESIIAALPSQLPTSSTRTKARSRSPADPPLAPPVRRPPPPGRSRPRRVQRRALIIKQPTSAARRCTSDSRARSGRPFAARAFAAQPQPPPPRRGACAGQPRRDGRAAPRRAGPASGPGP